MSKTYVSASLRRMVCDRANGYCEYCLIPETLALSSHQIDISLQKNIAAKQLKVIWLYLAQFVTKIKAAILPRSIQKQMKWFDFTTLEKIAGKTIFNFKLKVVQSNL
jgi:hypothetical protein